MSTYNQDIRSKAKERGVMLWEIAEAIGINDSSFSRKLRRELPDEHKAEIYGIIDRVAAQHAAQSAAAAEAK